MANCAALEADEQPPFLTVYDFPNTADLDKRTLQVFADMITKPNTLSPLKRDFTATLSATHPLIYTFSSFDDGQIDVTIERLSPPGTWKAEVQKQYPPDTQLRIAASGPFLTVHSICKAESHITTFLYNEVENAFVPNYCVEAPANLLCLQCHDGKCAFASTNQGSDTTSFTLFSANGELENTFEPLNLTPPTLSASGSSDLNIFLLGPNSNGTIALFDRQNETILLVEGILAGLKPDGTQAAIAQSDRIQLLNPHDGSVVHEIEYPTLRLFSFPELTFCGTSLLIIGDSIGSNGVTKIKCVRIGPNTNGEPVISNFYLNGLELMKYCISAQVSGPMLSLGIYNPADRNDTARIILNIP